MPKIQTRPPRDRLDSGKLVTMIQDAGFLEAIFARPHDDAPRLLWADWLDESDDPVEQARGELVRLQCALARLRRDDEHWLAYSARQSDLIHAYGAMWAKPIERLAVGYEFRRGLLDSVSVEGKTFLKHSETLFARAPIRRVRIIDANKHLDRLIRSPALLRIRELDLCSNDLGNGGVLELLQSESLGHLAHLDLSFNHLTDAAVIGIARAECCPQLRSLSLANNHGITSVGLTALAGSAHLAELRHLDVSENQIRFPGVQALVDSTYLAKLNRVSLYGNPLDAQSVEALLNSPLLRRMLAKEPGLDFRRCELGPDAAVALARAPLMRGVRWLDLADNDLIDVGVMRLAESGNLTSLTELTLTNNRISDAGAVLLARSPLMRQLRRLDIAHNQITQRGIDELWKRRANFHCELDTSDNLGKAS
ncbi:MAG: TIGR02996 domain-containing protein [Fimbriiglobus sp.]